MAEAVRTFRAVGFDWHGLIIERQVDDIDAHPEQVVEVAMQNAARAYEQAVRNCHGWGFPSPLDPRKVWEREQVAMAKVPREKGGKPLRHRDFLIEVNLAALWGLNPVGMGKLRAAEAREIAEEVRRVRRSSPMASYVMYSDMREFVKWVLRGYGAPSYLVTGQERNRVNEQAEACRVSLDGFKDVYTADKLGGTKLSRHFWKELLVRLELKPEELLMIGNEVTIDATCAEEGIPSIILDRGGVKEEFFRRDTGFQTRYGVPFKSLHEDIPPRAAFIGFAKSPAELKLWLERMPASPPEERKRPTSVPVSQ